MTERGGLDVVAQELDSARRDVHEIDQFAGRVDLTLRDAYQALLLGIARRQGCGEKVVGVKLGFTSREKAEQMGVSDVILGVLTDGMQVSDGGAVNSSLLIHPRVEPEIAFRLSGELPADLMEVGVEGLLPYVTHVAPAVEVIDSRYRDFSFSLQDVIADNTSASHFAFGDWRPLTKEMRDGGLADLAVELKVDDRAAASGSTKAILGNPLNSLAAALRLARAHGHPILPGGVVLAGAATAAVPLQADSSIHVKVEGLGTVSLTTGVRGERGVA